MRNLTVSLVAIAAFWWFTTTPDTVAITLPDGAFQYPGYQFSAAEAFTLEGRVLSRKDYGTGREADLSPTDLAMGWGRMADEDVVQAIDVSQSNRWYRWWAQQLPIPRSEIQTHSANVHIVPANLAVEVDLSRVDQDDRIRLSGQLVDVRGSDGWRWNSSRTRSDTGAGSCELLLLERIDWL
ncbi:MAG: hypothetical protein ACC642_04725 [Pseudomonadales bacterium]